MKATPEENLLLVNMEDCSNRVFVFKNNRIIKSKRVAAKDAQTAIVYTQLSSEIQDEIDHFLNPKAI
ncbi:MAG: hypothetical protein KA397_01115 [Paludibacteraceae bacterium]|nr:hypothetical protein [Paludibacteraceae bacterium]MBP6284266.1 hypothetical protein [Paludibacteraceae bacterium]